MMSLWTHLKIQAIWNWRRNPPEITPVGQTRKMSNQEENTFMDQVDTPIRLETTLSKRKKKPFKTVKNKIKTKESQQDDY
jgi:hypothetical protein